MTVLSCIIMLNVKKNYPTLPNIVLGILISVFVYYINYFLSLLGEKEKINIAFFSHLLLILFLICSIFVAFKEIEKYFLLHYFF